MKRSQMLGITLVFAGMFIALSAGDALAACGPVADSQCTVAIPPCQAACSGGISIHPTTNRKDCDTAGSDPGQICNRSLLQCGWILTWDNSDCTGNSVVSQALVCACA